MYGRMGRRHWLLTHEQMGHSQERAEPCDAELALGAIALCWLETLSSPVLLQARAGVVSSPDQHSSHALLQVRAGVASSPGEPLAQFATHS